jgi:hypothetical protein
MSGYLRRSIQNLSNIEEKRNQSLKQKGSKCYLLPFMNDFSRKLINFYDGEEVQELPMMQEMHWMVQEQLVLAVEL